MTARIVERMRKALTPATVALLAAGCLAGAPAAAAPCKPGLLSDYTGLANCTIGGLTFSGFSVELFPGATLQIDPTMVMLSPVDGGFGIGSTPLSALAGDLLGLRFLFQVSSGQPLTGGTIALGDDRSVIPDGVITGLLSAGAAGDAIAFDIGIDAQPSASFVAAPASFFDVFVELGIDGGTGGQAAIGPTLATVRFAPAVQQVPEPASLSVAALGLLALVAGRRRRAAISAT